MRGAVFGEHGDAVEAGLVTLHFLHSALGVDGHPGRCRAGFAGECRGRYQLRGGLHLMAGAWTARETGTSLRSTQALVVIHVRP